MPASRKLQASDAEALLEGADRLIAMKGKKVETFELVGQDQPPQAALASMLGPTGNMRAPTLQVGKTLLVGYNDEVFTDTFS